MLHLLNAAQNRKHIYFKNKAIILNEKDAEQKFDWTYQTWFTTIHKLQKICYRFAFFACCRR